MKTQPIQTQPPCGWCGKEGFHPTLGVCLECWETVKELVLERRIKKLADSNKV